VKFASILILYTVASVGSAHAESIAEADWPHYRPMMAYSQAEVKELRELREPDIVPRAKRHQLETYRMIWQAWALGDILSIRNELGSHASGTITTTVLSHETESLPARFKSSTRRRLLKPETEELATTLKAFDLWNRNRNFDNQEINADGLEEVCVDGGGAQFEGVRYMEYKRIDRSNCPREDPEFKRVRMLFLRLAK
jgi:hypothetical protein